MWSKIKKIAGNVFNNILVFGLTEVAKQFVFILFGASIAAIISGFLSTFSSIFKYRMWLIFIFGILGAIASILLFRKITPIITVYKSIQNDYKILSEEILYEYKSKNEMICTKKTYLKMLKKDITKYSGKYLWTGCGTVEIILQTPQYELNESSRNDVYNWYEIWFGRYLKKKDSVDFALRWQLQDTENTAVPILSAFIIEPMKKLSLSLKLPAEFNVQKVFCEEYESVTTNNKPPMKSSDKELFNGEVTWEIVRPKLFHKYSIRWEM